MEDFTRRVEVDEHGVTHVIENLSWFGLMQAMEEPARPEWRRDEKTRTQTGWTEDPENYSPNLTKTNQYIRHGWSDGREHILKEYELAKTLIGLGTKTRRKRTHTPGKWAIPRVIQGRPRPAKKHKKQKVEKPVVNIVLCRAAGGGTNSMRFGAAILAIAEGLEQSGVSTGIAVTEAGSWGPTRYYSAAWAKEPAGRLDPQRLAFALAWPDYLGSVIFRCIERIPEIPTTIKYNYYGQTTEVPLKYLPPNTIYIQNYHSTPVDLTTPESTIQTMGKWLSRTYGLSIK